ncbi:MAG: FHA domain-containing protein [Actinomycetota bacterium]|nr:FHA domain-containing protein [Actinomycetota bacterium]
MSGVCPRGHPSEADDYCDVCGTRMGGAPTATIVAGGPGPDGEPLSPGPVSSTPDPQPAAPTDPQPSAPTEPCPVCAAPNPPGGRFCEDCGADLAVPVKPPAGGADPAGVGHWEAVVTADRDYYERMDGGGIEFPLLYIDRRFVLRAPTAAIGRRSVSKGVEPVIDLSAAPEDIGVSHQHAVLVVQPDGAWSLVDPGSTNGTYLNDDPEPLARNQPVTLHDGDRVHVGAWTCITVRHMAPGT